MTTSITFAKPKTVSHARKSRPMAPSRFPTHPSASRTRSRRTSGLQLDLMALAYTTDLTRVFTFMMSRDVTQRVYPEIGITEPHHAMSHHGGNEEMKKNLVKLNVYHMTLFEKFVATTQQDSGWRWHVARSFHAAVRQRHEREPESRAPRLADVARRRIRRARQPARSNQAGHAGREFHAVSGTAFRCRDGPSSVSARAP